jgi:oligoendopeptidase F
MKEKRKTLPKREEILVEFRWKLEDIFPTDELWEEEYKAVEGLIPDVEKFQGKLAESHEELLACLEVEAKVSERLERLFAYAMMRRDEDTANVKYQAFFDRTQSLAVRLSQAAAYIVPELLDIPDDILWGFVDKSPKLAIYRHYLEDIIRSKPHVRSKSEEEILALAGEMSGAPRNIFVMLDNADIRFPSIRDEEGNEVELTKGRYLRFMESQDRRVRADAFRALYSTYDSHINTLAAALSATVKNNIFWSKVRKYPSTLVAALEPDNIPISVYENLIKAVRENLPALHRYMELRSKALNLDEVHMYDIYVPIIKEVDIKVPYEEAKKKVIEGLNPLGDNYIEELTKGFDSGWIDVYENQGKRSGAYSAGAYGVHPYVLLNYEDTLDNVFTIAHEMGHAMHTFYSAEKQPYIYSDYTIFVAEVASTVNEALLIENLLKNNEDSKVRMYLINHYLEQFRGTVYRQTMFAEFEKIIHERAEAGDAITSELLKSVYRDLNIAYYGPKVVIDEEIDIEWARIPHFHRSFYVYKYATGFSAAIALSQQILSQGSPAVERYINFLSSGSSNYSLELLKGAGVDMTSPEPIKNALKLFSKLVDELQAELD